MSVEPISTVVIEGRINPGLGTARPNLAVQLPKVAAGFPRVKDCYFGTINIRTATAFQIIQPDFTTKPIEWMPNVIENFSLTEFQFEYQGALHPAWVYNPQYSPHRFRKDYLEIVAPFIEGISAGNPCRLHFPKGKVEVVG